MQIKFVKQDLWIGLYWKHTCLGQYDLVSLLSAAIAVVNEKEQNAPGERPGQEARELKP